MHYWWKKLKLRAERRGQYLNPTYKTRLGTLFYRAKTTFLWILLFQCCTIICLDRQVLGSPLQNLLDQRALLLLQSAIRSQASLLWLRSLLLLIVLQIILRICWNRNHKWQLTNYYRSKYLTNCIRNVDWELKHFYPVYDKERAKPSDAVGDMELFSQAS